MIRARVWAFALTLIVMPAAFCQVAENVGLKTQEQLKQLDNKVLQAEKTLNVALLDQLFAPGYTLTLPSGEKYDKQKWLTTLKGPDHPIIESIEATNIHVHLFGDIAVVTDTTILKSHDSKGQPFNGTFQVVRLMVRQRGNWRVGGVDMTQPKAD